MRDDLFKAASVPPQARRWAKMSAREADVQNGRARAALEDLVRSDCRREISPRFLKWFAALHLLRTARSLLTAPADFLDRPSGDGGPLEYDVLCAVSDVMNEPGVTAEHREREAVDSLGRAIRDRLESYIRAFEAEAQTDRDPEARRWIEQMREDQRRFDPSSFASKYLLDSQFREGRPEMPRLSADEDLTRRTRNLEDNDD